MNSGDFVLKFVYYSDQKGGKRRQLFVYRIEGQMAIVFKVTSRYHLKPAHIRRCYFPVKHWEMAGLDKLSYIDTYSYPIRVPIETLKDRIGTIGDVDLLEFTVFLEWSLTQPRFF